MTLPANSQLIEADERLATVFSHFYCVQQPSQAISVSQQLLPNYEMLLVFNFGPAIPFALGDSVYEVQQIAVVGPLQKMLRYELPPNTDLIVVNFTLNGFYRLLGVPMHQFKTTEWENPDVLLNSNCFDELWQQVAPMTTLANRLQRISEYALTHLAPIDVVTDSLLESIPYFKQTAVDPVKAIAQQNQVSTRSIQNRFQTHLGYSAKELTRFLRFKKVLGFLSEQQPGPVDWLALVLDFGYHDHSHLIKDFHYFLGVTPRHFLSQLAQGGVCISKSGKFY
ncbi:helix-turn-helix domain-containing protein [Spirosoma validum]|uniref:AraC family transcriptional regulator n=1 Tax=Spirosoma validum TaxID=2771355 RepID=A0A927B1S3_9BACT|nr:helix-turn-helix domain-containing protein [Spirosoma validum]MBD2753979.1 AraC family transcriptional regulator [Spirosoma validum]